MALSTDVDVPDPVRSSSVAVSAATVESSALNLAELKERRQRKKLRLKKLEKKLEILDRQIKKCAEADLSLDELESGYSAYIKEDLLKKKFVKTWQELCQLRRVSDSIMIDDRTNSTYDGTAYPEVNRRVQRLLHLDEFPDYIDIVQLLDRCNTKHSLGIASDEKGQLSRKVFKDVGRIMKRRRHRDFLHHFGSHLTDTISMTEDPAEKDEDLLKELQENLREGEKRMEAIVEDFVIKQEQMYGTQRTQEGDSCSANERDEEEQQDEEEDEDDDEREAEELINVVDDGEVESEVQSGSHVEPCLSSRAGEFSGGEEGWLCAAIQLEIAPDSTTIHTESTEVTSTRQKQVSSSVQEQAGPSGLIPTHTTHVGSSSDVVCLDDDDDDVMIISDSD